MASISVTSTLFSVTINISIGHPLIRLKKSLDWELLESVLGSCWRDAGKNVDGRPGRRFDLPYWTRVMVLMFYRGLDSRKMERELKENAAAICFVSVPHPLEGTERDHSNIDLAYRALGPKGLNLLNHLVLGHALKEEFTDSSQLSADPTCQEAHIGYPNEPGILRKVAERVKRLWRRLVKKGVEVSEEVVESVEKVIRTVKEYSLFCKEKEEKTEVMERMLEESKQMMENAAKMEEICGRYLSDTTVRKAKEKLSQLRSFVDRLVPQIRHWLSTKKVAKGKLLHPGMEEARSIVRNKAGSKWEYGFKWLVCWLKGGYVFGKMFITPPAESNMPLEAILAYQELFGGQQVPELYVHDRGGWSKKVVDHLKEMEIKNVGIQPRGKADWLVGESERDTVRSIRAKTEGIIGTLKTEKYGFNDPKTKSTTTTEMAGQRAFVSKNLNKFLSDILKKEKVS